MQRWRKRYDGTVQSLALKSRRPKSHPKQHTTAELELIKKCLKRYRHEGYAQVYVMCLKKGYQRSFSSMIKQIKKVKIDQSKYKKNYPKSNWKPDQVVFPGEKVQIDIKYVPKQCIGWDSKGIRYYQITAIDEYSRKRVCRIVDEKSVTHTAQFLLDLEEKNGI